MNPVGRRNFAKGLGLLGLFSVGTAAYAEAKERIVYKQDELASKELEEQIQGRNLLSLHTTYGTPKPREPNSYGYYLIGDEFVEGTKKDIRVDLAPGPDGKLYVKENGVWRKI